MRILIGIGAIIVAAALLFAYFFYIYNPTIEETEALTKQAKERLSQVKVASLYEKVTDGIYYGSPYRSLDEMIKLFDETKTDFIFRGWWRWSLPCPELPETAPSLLAKYGYTYQQFEEVLKQIKLKRPNIIFCGAVPAQRINFEERNSITGETYNENQTWDMALDPAKWNIKQISKDQLQEYFQEHATGKDGYYPDITNREFQELFLSWSKRQVDAGAEAIWIDMLFGQARIFKAMTNNPNHPAVKESYEAASMMIDEIRDYGYSQGKYIYVGTWWEFIELPYSFVELDFVTATPSPDEVVLMKLDESKWDNDVEEIRSKLGNIPIFAFIDWADTTETALGKFSQSLTSDEQKEFLKTADKVFQEKEINFIYPLHGGFVGQEATIISFDSSRAYDSLAPEFNTYETIKELAQNKSKIKKSLFDW